MRQDLIGYLLDSVDEDERVEIESSRQSPETASKVEHDLAMLERALKPLERLPQKRVGHLARLHRLGALYATEWRARRPPNDCDDDVRVHVVLRVEGEFGFGELLPLLDKGSQRRLQGARDAFRRRGIERPEQGCARVMGPEHASACGVALHRDVDVRRDTAERDAV